MADNCLVGCIREYTCQGLRTSVVDQQEIVSPWVKMYFGDDRDVAVTVGNQSQPQYGNTAIIKSFQYGRTDGVTAECEIIDEQGGSFQKFIEKIAKCMDKLDGDSPYGHVAYEFGWTASNCTGGEGGDLGNAGSGGNQSGSLARSARLEGLFQNIEVSFENGVVKFRCTMTDLVQSTFVSRMDKTEGDDDNPVTLKQAIRNLARKDSPKFKVAFRKRDGTEWNFKKVSGDSGEKEGPEGEGPLQRWDADGQNKLGIMAKWIEPYRTEDDKGIVPMWDDSTNTLIFMEGLSPRCNEKLDCRGDTHIGTFIVNGGRCSPVISFSPKLNFIAAFSSKETGGATGSAVSGQTETKEDADDCKKQAEQTGMQTGTPPTQNATGAYGPSEAVPESSKSQIAHSEANGIVQLTSGAAITAELTIVGDPRITGFDVVGKFASIVLINPFHIFGNSNQGCGDWLAVPGCNEVLSNKNWLIQGFDHQIKEGSYVTTLKLLLPTPGNDLSNGNNFGASNNGYRPPDICNPAG